MGEFIPGGHSAIVKEAEGQEKVAIIELQTETQISPSEEEAIPLKAPLPDDINELYQQISGLREMLRF